MPIDQRLLSRLRAAPEERIVAELRRIHARNAEEPGRRGHPTPAAPDADGDTAYERARRHFASEEQRLRQRTLVTERIVEDLRRRRSERPAAAATQETLVLRAALGRSAAGRFRLANRFARSLDVVLDASELRMRSGGPVPPCPVVIAPSRVHLAPGAEAIVRVAFELHAIRGALSARAVLEGEIVACAGGTDLHRLWVEIELYAPLAGEETS